MNRAGVIAATLNAGQETPHPKGAATAAHLHVGARRKAGPVAIPLCGPCTSGATGTATLSASQLEALRSSRLYVNVHTAAASPSTSA